MTRVTVALMGTLLCFGILTGCSSVPDEQPPTPSAPDVESVEVPTEPTHPQYVPSDFIPPGSQGSGTWSGEQAEIVLAASIDGLGYPLPSGGEYVFPQMDPTVGWAVGTLESVVALQWHCAWLAEWQSADDRGDAALASEILVLADQFWTLPHIELLALDGVSFRDQQVAAAPAGADLNVWMLRNC